MYPVINDDKWSLLTRKNPLPQYKLSHMGPDGPLTISVNSVIITKAPHQSTVTLDASKPQSLYNQAHGLGL